MFTREARMRRAQNALPAALGLVPPGAGAGPGSSRGLDAAPGWIFLPLTAADFRSGWTLDWSPELQSEPLPPVAPRGRRS